jgi:hypothetical protein
LVWCHCFKDPCGGGWIITISGDCCGTEHLLVALVAGGSAVECECLCGSLTGADVWHPDCFIVLLTGYKCWQVCCRGGLGALDGEEERDGSGGLSHGFDERLLVYSFNCSLPLIYCKDQQQPERL